jgi:hypothetical protein
MVKLIIETDQSNPMECRRLDSSPKQHAPGHGGAYLKCRRLAAAFAYVFNIHAIVLGIVASICVYLCHTFRFTYQLEFAFVSLGVTFPLTFAIAQQFTRRERALTDCAWRAQGQRSLLVLAP